MGYTPINFQNKPATTTPLSATALNFMQTQHAQALADVRGELVDPESLTGAAAATAAKAAVLEDLQDPESPIAVQQAATIDVVAEEKVAPVAKRGGPVRIVTLLAGTEDETVSASSCTLSLDTTNWKVGGQGRKMTMAGAVSGRMTVTPVSPATSGQMLPVPPAQAVSMWAYVPDPTKITSLSLYLMLDSGNTVIWTRSVAGAALTVGWNLVRFVTSNGANVASWGNINRMDVYAITNAATEVTIGQVFLECPEKARMVFVLDRGYRSFITSGGLARLRAAKIPVTWALDITLLGSNVGTFAEAITEAEVAQFAAEGDSISFHGWDGAPTVGMTAAQYRADTAKAIKWLESRGYTGGMWRAAVVQNSAAQGLAIKDLVLASATYTSVASLDAWPPVNRWDIPRLDFYVRTEAQLDTTFDLWKKTHGFAIYWNHGISTNANDSTPEKFDYWMTKIEAALEDGWLEAGTFEQFWLESGARWGDSLGANVIQYSAGGSLLARTVI